MDPWTEILNKIWYYLEQGPESSAVTAAFPAANRYKYGSDLLEATPPQNVSQPVLIVDQQYQITVWSATLELANVNDLGLKVLAAIDPGLPDLGLDNVMDVKFLTSRMTLALDKIERDADGRLLPWRHDFRKARQRAVLLELIVTFLIDRSNLSS